MTKPGNGDNTRHPDVAQLYEYERRDARMVLWAALAADQDVSLVPESLEVVSVGEKTWIAMGLPESPEKWATDLKGVLTTDGVVRFQSPDAPPAN